MGGINEERQEDAFIKAVKSSVKKNNKNPISIDAGGKTIHGIIDAVKYTGRQSSGSEPYTDIILIRRGFSRQINLSLKRERSPSLAGGGLRGIETIVPGIAERFMRNVLNRLLGMGLKPGAKVPDVYGQISRIVKEKIVVGNSAMGGPIDYMFIGPINVKSEYDDDDNILYLNGELIEAKEYAKSTDLFFRLRARREDQRFDPKSVQGGMPTIYGRSPSKGDSSGRIVVTDSVPKDAIIVKI